MLSGGSDSKESTCTAGDLGSIPGSGRSLGVGLGNPLQYSCLENPMDRGAWQVKVYGVTKSQTGLNNLHFYPRLQSASTWCWSDCEEIPHIQGQSKRVPEKHLFLLY